MKKFFATLFVLVNFLSVFAYNGMMSGEKDIKVVSTKWFDIVYAPSGEHTASLLYENADSIYEEIAQMYGRKIIYRMPVVVTTKVEMFNAYFANSFYNHIVLYDTYQIDDLAVFSDTMLSTFRHELTHAYTMNLSDPLWQGIKSAFGDVVNPLGVNITSGWCEGATLTSESAKGEGRLNDEYAKKTVRQAKLENKFPCYKKVQGDADVYPVGSFYYFNGAFDKYLQDKYGMAKYSQFWYEAVNCHHIFTSHVFKVVYGKSLSKEWKQFTKEYEVPEIPGNPVKAGLAQDLFDKNKNDYSSLNKAGYIYSSLSLSEKGLTFIDDYKTSAVYFVDAKNINNSKVKPKKLFTMSGLTSAKQSSDGKYIAISYTDCYSKATYQAKTALYDTDSKKFIKFKENGSGEAAVAKFEDDYYLIETKFKSQFYKLQITKLAEDGKKTEEVSVIEFPFEVFPHSITDLGNGTFAFLKKDRLNWSICVADLNGNLLKEVNSPYERMVIRNLSCSDNGEIYFSYTKPGKMPDLGKLNLAENAFNFRSEDISGGVYYPLSNGETVIYSGNFYRMNRLLTMKPEFTESVPADVIEDVVIEIPSEEPFTLDGKKYNPFKFYKKGLFIPATIPGLNPLVSYGVLNDTTVLMPLTGMSYFTRNPWDGNTLGLTAGYGIYTNSFAANLTYSSGTNTSLFNYSLSGQIEVDSKGFKEGILEGSVSTVIPFGNISCFVASLSTSEKIGRENYINTDTKASSYSELVGIYTPIDSTVYFSNANGLMLYYTNIHKSGPGRFEKCGVKAGTELYYNFKSEVNDDQEIFLNAGNLGAFAQVYIPRLLPINCLNDLEYNLPTKLCAAVYPSSNMNKNFAVSYIRKDGKYLNGLMCFGETILFSGEIQHPLPITQLLYFNQFSISATCLFGYSLPEEGYTNWNFLKTADYVNQIASGNVNLEVYPGIKATLGVTPKGGILGTLNTYAALNFVKEDSVIKPYLNLGVSNSF